MGIRFLQACPKLYCMLFTLFFAAQAGQGQTVQSPKIESPNVAGFNKFGDIPVNLFTGVPNIAIPVYTLQYGKISVPIALRYHPGSTRPAQHPGWVGMGWDLESIGCITRKVNRLPDEFYGSLIMGTLQATYFPNPYQTGPFGADKADVSDWNSTTKLGSYFSCNPDGCYTDVQADEFSFNFLGYGGKFYYSGAVKGWQVVADEKIKVELMDNVNPCLTPMQVMAAASEFFPHLYISPTYEETQTRIFKGFKITVPDGTKYIFGGADAIELYGSYGTLPVQFNASTWLLKKIIDANNNEVTFQYRRSYPTVDLGFGMTEFSYNCYQTNGGFLNNSTSSGWSTATIDVNTHSGNLGLPMYLSQITTPNESITFNGAVSTALRYSNDVLYSRTVGNPATAFNHALLNNDLSHLQWEQLNSIVIKDNNQNIYKQYQFNYSNVTTQRLTLNSFFALDKLGTTVERFYFDYNNEVQNLPAASDGNYIDHWGFYNNKSLAGATAPQVFALKETDPAYVTKGMLKKITYPTGGYTELTWEAHDYSQTVSKTRNSLVSNNGYAGGGRIGELKSYSNTGELALHKKYYYKRNYTNGVNVNTLTSSGILNGAPQYYFSIPQRLAHAGLIKVAVEFAAINSLNTYSYNAQGSYIGYDEVAEVNADGSYTRHFFTSYGPDINNITHYDQLPAGYIGWVVGEDSYIPMSSLERERGKPAGIFHYAQSNKLVEKTIFTYRNDAERFSNYIKFLHLSASYGGCVNYDALILATACKVFAYNYYLVKKETTSYDLEGNNPFLSTVNYKYNAFNLVSEVTETTSKNTLAKTTYKYPADLPDPIYQSMVTAHILSPVIEEARFQNGAQLTFARTNYYSPYAGIYLPQNIQIQNTSSAVETRQQFHLYNTYGNILEQSKTDDVHEVFLWGYGGRYPVARITGTDYNTAVQYVNQAILDNPGSDQQLRTELNNLRTNLPNAFITTWTYAPLTGITSETDARGKTIYFQYDNFQRLQLIKDQDGNVIKTFNYNYRQ